MAQRLSYFKENIIISGRFFLHGKVECCAISRIEDQLYYIAARHKETLWDFADALREYGFIDTIYIGVVPITSSTAIEMV